MFTDNNNKYGAEMRQMVKLMDINKEKLVAYITEIFRRQNDQELLK